MNTREPVPRMRWEALRGTYLKLGTGELTAAAVFAAVAAGVITPRLEAQHDVIALWCALVPLLVILVQAGAYWLLARRRIGRAPMPARVRAVYRVFRYGNPVALVVALIAFLVWQPSQFSLLALVLAVWLFAVVEHVNYFVVRVAYPLERWLRGVRRRRRPRLLHDLTSVQ